MRDAQTAPRYIAVIGPGVAEDTALRDAHEVGRLLGLAGAVLLTGGLGGVMAAACRGAVEAGGLTVGLLPGTDRRTGNPYLRVALATGLGESRNGLLVRAADAVIAVGGSWGTLSEISLAVRTGVTVISLGGWTLPPDGPIAAATAEEAVALALAGGEPPSASSVPRSRV